MKKLITIILSALACACMAIGFTACGGSGGDTPSESAPQDSSSVKDDESAQQPDDSSANNNPLETESLEYTLSDDGSYYICSGIGTVTKKDIVIADTYNGLPVKSIRSSAFRHNSDLISVTIPEGVTTIGYYAFSNCSNLRKVVLPKSITFIDDGAFGYCYNLTGLYITDIAAWCAIDFAETYSYPFEYAQFLYVNNQPIIDLIIPEGVTEIKAYAFYGYEHLTSVTIPSSVATIGSSAFEECEKLVEVVNQSSLEFSLSSTDNGYIGYYAKQIVTDEKDSKMIEQDDYIFYNDNGSYYLLGYKGTDIALVLPDTINGNTYEIYTLAFYYYSSIISVTIPDGVTFIGKHAFRYCSRLISAKIGNGVTEIASCAFAECDNLRSVSVGEGVTSIAANAFGWCYNLWEVIDHSSLGIEVGDEFNGGIAEYAKQVIQDEKDSRFIAQGDYVFYNDDETYYLLDYIGTATEIVLPTSINGNSYAIADYAFSSYVDLISVTIPNGVGLIGRYAFEKCFALKSVTICDGVDIINDHAFDGCNSLTNVTLENPNGWNVDGEALSTTDLLNATTTAEFLTNKYRSNIWIRVDE